MGVFGKLAYAEGATVGTLLATRFVLAAALLWLLVLCTGGVRRLRTLRRRDVAIALALGAIGYGAQAGAYFAALERLDASLLAMLVYTFPAIVTVAAIALGRESASRRTGLALALASAGLVLVLAGAASGALDGLGTVLGLGAAVVYSAYILSSEGVATRVDHPDARESRRRRPEPRSRQHRGDRLAGRHRGRLDSRRRPALLRRAATSRADGRVDPLDGRARRHRGARVRSVRRVARSRSAGRRSARPRSRARRASLARSTTAPRSGEGCITHGRATP
jgi:uncharacterized membrane protein